MVGTATRRYLLEVISALAMVKRGRKSILVAGGLHYLVEAVGSGSLASRERACQAIGLIAASSKELRHIIAEKGAIPLLINLFHDGNSQTKLVAANALGLTLTHLGYIRAAARAGSIPLYSELLREGDLNGKAIAVDGFCLLSIAQENVVSIAEHIVGILKDCEAADDAKGNAFHVLWDIAAYKHSIPVVENSGAFPLLFQLLLLQGDNSYSLRVKVCSVIAKLSSNKVDRPELVDAAAIPLLLDLLKVDSTDIPLAAWSICRDFAAIAIKNLYE